MQQIVKEVDVTTATISPGAGRMIPGQGQGGSVVLVDVNSLDPMSVIDCLPEVVVPVATLVPGFHLRQGGTDKTHVRLLADAASARSLPSILVQKTGSRVIDGMHRLEVAKLRGEWSIRARIVDCTDEQALVLAVRSNTLHGLPLSRADRISSAKRILASHPDWSDRAVAAIAGLNAKAIASLRGGAISEAGADIKRLGRDGKRRPVDASEGRKRAAEYLSAHPQASLREVARETDVSPGTVHDVRERLRRGMPHLVEDPERRTGRAVECRPAAMAAPPAPAVDTPVSSPPRREAAARPRPAWPAVYAKLSGDPALRYTDDGRAFLRWMAAHSMKADEWREFAHAVPQRWLNDVHRMAVSMSQEWGQFAEWLKDGRDGAD
jgi:ParB-like chromosome segregation protein Spo0J